MKNQELMDWATCEREFVRKVEVDSERIKSIMKKAIQRLKRAQTTKPTPETTSFIVEDYYEVIKEILVAYMLKHGLRSKNHQCLISYFYMKNPELETEANIIAQMSYFRNRLDYYGEDVPTGFYTKNREEFNKIINKLIKLMENK